MTSPATRYSDSHLWFSREGDEVRVGITERIAGALTLAEAVFLPQPSSRVTAGHEFVQIDSQKAVFDIPAPVDLDVVTVNEDLTADPLLVRLEPRGAGGCSPPGWHPSTGPACSTTPPTPRWSSAKSVPKASENSASQPGWYEREKRERKR